MKCNIVCFDLNLYAFYCIALEKRTTIEAVRGFGTVDYGKRMALSQKYRSMKAYKELQFVQAESRLCSLRSGGISQRECYETLKSSGEISALSLYDFMRLCRQRRKGGLQC